MKHEQRKHILPAWIRFFSWIFLAFYIVSPLIFIVGLFTPLRFRTFGPEYYGTSLHPMPILLCVLLFFIAHTAYKILWGRDDAICYGLAIGYIGLVISVGVVKTLLAHKVVCFRLEIPFLILFLVSLHKKRRAWEEFEPPPYRTHTDSASGFSILLPVDWETVQQENLAVFALSAGSAKKSSNGRPEADIKVVAADLEENVSLEQYYNNSITAFASIGSVASESTVQQIGLPNKKVELVKSVGPFETMIIKLFVESGRKIFVVSCSAENERFEEYRECFETILQSFNAISNSS